MLGTKRCSFSTHNCPVQIVHNYSHFFDEKTENGELGALTRITALVSEKSVFNCSSTCFST